MNLYSVLHFLLLLLAVHSQIGPGASEEVTEDHLSALEPLPAAYNGALVDVVVTKNRAGDKVCTVSDEVELHSALAMTSCTVVEFEDDISLDATTTPMITSKMGLTIDGHGHTLSGANAKQCLYITNSDVVIKHLTFFQCNPDSDGGAIFSKNSVLSLSHCSFNENGLKGLHFGGAIRADDTDVDLEKCSFKGNKARDGGARK